MRWMDGWMLTNFHLLSPSLFLELERSRKMLLTASSCSCSACIWCVREIILRGVFGEIRGI